MNPAGSGALFYKFENLTYTDVVQAALSCVPERADEVKNLIANLTLAAVKDACAVKSRAWCGCKHLPAAFFAVPKNRRKYSYYVGNIA